MFFNIILSIAVGLILFFVVRKWNDKSLLKRLLWSEHGLILLCISLCFTISSAISESVFEHMLNLQTYCKSEPDYVTELISVSDDYAEVANSFNLGKKIVVSDGEFYYYCRTIPHHELGSRFSSKEKDVVIEKIKISDEIEVQEIDFPYAGAGVMKSYSYRYASWWGKFFFNNPNQTKRRIFLIPKGTFGKGKIVIPNPVPIYVPADEGMKD